MLNAPLLCVTIERIGDSLLVGGQIVPARITVAGPL
jgi:hypothetical protein